MCLQSSNFEDIFEKIKSSLDTSERPVKLIALFAYNTSGKTRLSRLFSEKYDKQVLCYNALFEDFFYWDNENTILKIDTNSWLAQLIKDEGLGTQISDNFKKLMNSKLEPDFDLDTGDITFGYFTGDETSSTNIKISRGEESIFIWSIFYTILKVAIETLQEDKEQRSTHFFDLLKYVVIDDPVSSMDDTRIITMALELIELIEQSGNTLKFFITTHHSLFYNILHSEKMYKCYKQNYLLLKGENNEFVLKKQEKDSPFAYHNLIVSKIHDAIIRNNVQKYHFNLFRALLEKTANFLGYSKKWSDLLDDSESKKVFVKQLHQYSHNSLSEIEAHPLSSKEIESFKVCFEAFINKFHWSCN